MNALTRTNAVLVALNLLISGLALAQDAPEQETKEAAVTETIKADLRREAEIAANQAHRQAEAAKKQAETDRKLADVELAKAISVSAPAQTVRPVTTQSISYRKRWPYLSESTGSVLVVPSTEIKAKDLLTINEDMNVMSRIFEDNLREARISPAGGGLLLSSGSSSLYALLGRGDAIQEMYLQGYGALFLMKMDFPLSAPPQSTQKEKTDDQGKTDEVWQRVRQQMYEPERVDGTQPAAKTEEYDALKVENLKTVLIKALKHAANIRNLQIGESVILTVSGAGESADVETIVMEKPDGNTATTSILVRDKKTGTTKMITGALLDDLGLSSTVLVIRAKKADIDGFAKGDLDLDQFRQRVQMLSYPLLGQATGSNDSTDSFRNALLDLTYESAR